MKIDNQKFIVNDYITLRLEDDTTSLYINNTPFLYCTYLLLSVPLSEIEKYEEIGSIDEAADILDHSLEG